MPVHGTAVALFIGVGFALAAAAVSSVRLFERMARSRQTAG
jgi:hypothetical protein